jgi:hypothetical protein
LQQLDAAIARAQEGAFEQQGADTVTLPWLLDAEGGFSLAREHRTEGAELSSPAQNAINEEAVDDYAEPVG